ncbi:MAG: hypothetical protein ACR2KJ_04020 [Jatrophihabitans sp.]
MKLPIPSPGDMVRLAEQSYGAVETAIGLVPRLVTIVAEVEDVVARVKVLVGDIDRTQKRAAQVVGRTEQLTERITPLLDRFEPTLDKLEPIVAKLTDTTSPAEVEAVVQLVNRLPEIVQKVDADILPILDTLGTVAPDLRDLLDASKELNEMYGAVPGLGRVKRKIEKEQDREDAAADKPAD